jgi:hypothetical protein
VAVRGGGGEDGRVSEPAPAPTPRRRGLETVGDMVRSLAVVGAFVLVLFLVVWWQRPEAQGPVDRPVDVTDVFAGAAISAGFPVLEPTGLPDGWSATSAWVQGPTASGVGGVVVHAGYLTPAGSYAEVKQTDGRLATAVADWTDDAGRTGTTTLAGRTWQTWESPTRKALVLQDGEVTRVVTGKADWPELQVLASSLVPADQVQSSSSPSPSASSG